MNPSYWPWWVGGPALAATAVLFAILAGAPLGVSGALARLRNWRSERRSPPAPEGWGPVDCGGVAPSAGGKGAPRPIESRIANLAFLAAIAAGGGLAGWVGGHPWGSTVYAPEFHRIFGAHAQAWVVLFVGGILVGIGTRLSGGCTSGHGLSGCGRLQPASLVATAVFFGVAIGVSFLLQGFQP